MCMYENHTVENENKLHVEANTKKCLPGDS